MIIEVKEKLISNYMICILLSYICGIGYASIRSKMDKVPTRIIGYSSMLAVGCSMYLAIIYTFMTSRSFGLSSMGAMFGIILSIIIIGNLDKEHSSIITKNFITSLPLFYGVSKLGCFLAGCCHGIDYNGPFNITYVGNFDYLYHSPVFPVQLVETIVFLFIFLIVCLLSKKKNISYITIILCSIAKFSLDYLRMSHKDIILSTNQVFCLISILATIVVYMKSSHSQKK